MATQEMVYNGRKIVITPQDTKTPVLIDGESIPVMKDPGVGEYIAVIHAPYLKHPTLIDLAKHVIDHVINQRSS
jgi:hypothetical protein